MANIVGTSGNDTLTGTNNTDFLEGSGGDDSLNGLAGDDVLDGGRGNDRLDGGAGSDMVTYRSFTDPRGVQVDLSAGTATDPFGGHDTLISIGFAEGSAGRDSLAGNDNVNLLRGLDGDDSLSGRGGDDRLEGGAGQDWLDGGAGNDRLDGGSGSDHVSYFDSPAGVSVNLATGTARDGYGTTDTIISIGHANGSDHNDTLIGNNDVNHLSGGNGDDTLEGGGGNDWLSGDYVEIGAGNDRLFGGDGDDTLFGSIGDDLLDGGSGNDTVTYVESFGAGSNNAVVVDLTAGTARDQFGGTDTIVSVGHVTGSFAGDTLSGNDNANILIGVFGDDTLNGRGGADTLIGEWGDDTLDGGADDARDVFIYDAWAGHGSDLIRNLEAGEDVLRLEQVAEADAKIAVQDDGTDTRLTFDDGATITLVGVTQAGTGSFDSLSELVSAGIVELA